MATSKIPFEKYGNNLDNINHGLFSNDGQTQVLNNVDLNTVSTRGNTFLVTNATNYPTGTSHTGRLFVIQTAASDYNNIFQLYFPNYGAMHVRRKTWNSSQGDFVWGNWYSVS